MENKEFLEIKVKMDLENGEIYKEIPEEFDSRIPDNIPHIKPADLFLAMGADIIVYKVRGKRAKQYVKESEKVYVDHNSITRSVKYKRTR